MTQTTAESVLTVLLHALEQPAASAPVCFTGRADALPSPYAVAPFAAASVASALTCIAACDAARRGTPVRDIMVDRLHAAAAFRSERALSGIGFTLPEPWDPIAGDYESADGFVRLHTNYAHHQRAALTALKAPADRSAVAAIVRSLPAEVVEAAVVAAGGAAAAMRSAEAWQRHPQGIAVAAEPLVHVSARAYAAPDLPTPSLLPLSGVRVLDLTRVIAGPVCTRLLAAYGADVLRIDPPGFAEVPALLGDTTWGKRRATLDLRTAAGQAALTQLLRQAHVLVVGYRAAALAHLGLTEERLRTLFPSLTVALLHAYGHSGPWCERRGFDSLVQMSVGIAECGQRVRGARSPVPMPAQALDHGTGYLLAAAVAAALTVRVRSGAIHHVRLSLARTAQLLLALGDDHDSTSLCISDAETALYTTRVDTAFGAMRRVTVPGAIAGYSAREGEQAGPLGSHPARFADVSPQVHI